MIRLLSFLFRCFFRPDPGAAGKARSGKWRAVEQRFLKRHPKCAVCGSTVNVNAHHVIPFHVDPSKELKQSNLISLCRDHHFWWGHLGSWKSYNAFVRLDAKLWRRKIMWRPKG